MKPSRFEELSTDPLISMGDLIIVIILLIGICMGIVGLAWQKEARRQISDVHDQYSALLLRLDQVDSTMKRLISEIEKVSSLKVDLPLESFKTVTSWYGAPYHLRVAASGEIFNKFEMTAAHRTLPFGTRIRLSSPKCSIIVRINDRGPFIEGRDLDISESAAEALGIREMGIATLRAEILSSKIH